MRRLEDFSSEQTEEIIQESIHGEWRLGYHIQPVMGELGAPCGFVYINGLYHLFYEWCPTVDNESVKYLYHVTSTDLVNWENEGIKVYPDDLYDNYDIYGGSLVVVNDVLTLFYTGLQEKNDGIYTYQLAGTMDTDFKIKKLSMPILRGIEENYQTYFRNPYIFVTGNEINMMIGTMNQGEFGRILMYRGSTLNSMKYVGEVDTGYDMFGYFWESPELFHLDDAEVLIINPRGLDKYKDFFWNIYQSGYMVNDFEYGSLFVNHDDYHEFDEGFDFYRPVTTTDSEGRRVLIAWMSAHESHYPTETDLWKNALTIPRLLNVYDDQLIQTPHPNLKSLRGEKLTALGYFNQHKKQLHDFYGSRYELNINIRENNSSELVFMLRKSRREETILKYETKRKRLTLDRTFSGRPITGVDGTMRSVILNRALEDMTIFMDESSIEIFVNHGEHTMTARIFPRKESIGVEVMTEDGECYVDMAYYSLKSFKEVPILTNKKKM